MTILTVAQEGFMKRAGLKRKCFAAIAVVMSFMVFAVPILAQQNDLEIGRMAGEQAARANVNGTLWLAAGCVSIFGIILAYLVEPSPPATALLGKSPEYVAAYTDAYKMTAKSIQTSKAWTGCIVGTLAYIALGVLAALAEEANN
jgi:hypothetical protein